MKEANKAFENVAEFKCLGLMLTNQKCIQRKKEEVKFKECFLPCSA
jgi:hypothetical protein